MAEELPRLAIGLGAEGSWQRRVLRATGALASVGPVETAGPPQSRLGAILLAVLGLTPHVPPAFGLGAVITSDGFIMCDFVDRQRQMHIGAFVGSIDDVVGNLRGLADHLKLTDAERAQMFATAKTWIKRDWRAVTSNPGKETL